MESLEMRFLKNQEAVGIHMLLEGDPSTRKLKSILSSLSHGPGAPHLFPGTKFFPLMIGDYPLTGKKPAPADVYVVAPKPLGIRCLLWADLKGQIFLENEDNQLFKVDEAFTNQLMIRKDTILDCVAARKIVRDGKGKSNGEANQMLTFVIIDAIRVYGRHVKGKTLQERISIVQAEIMQYRLGAVNSTTDRGVFDVDIAKYKPLSRLDEYLAPRFQDIYEYPISSLLFKPLNEPYSYKKGKHVMEWDPIKSEEFTFRLEIFRPQDTKCHLRALSSHEGKVKKMAATIDLTDELRAMDNKIIECRNVDGRWSFVRVRDDLEHPNVIVGQNGEIVAPVSRNFLWVTFRNYPNV